MTLRCLIKSRGYTQTELANEIAKLGLYCDAKQVSEWVRGKGVEKRYVKPLASILGVTPNRIIRLKGDIKVGILNTRKYLQLDVRMRNKYKTSIRQLIIDDCGLDLSLARDCKKLPAVLDECGCDNLDEYIGDIIARLKLSEQMQKISKGIYKIKHYYGVSSSFNADATRRK